MKAEIEQIRAVLASDNSALSKAAEQTGGDGSDNDSTALRKVEEALLASKGE